MANNATTSFLIHHWLVCLLYLATFFVMHLTIGRFCFYILLQWSVLVLLADDWNLYTERRQPQPDVDAASSHELRDAHRSMCIHCLD